MSQILHLQNGIPDCSPQISYLLVTNLFFMLLERKDMGFLSNSYPKPKILSNPYIDPTLTAVKTDVIVKFDLLEELLTTILFNIILTLTLCNSLTPSPSLFSFVMYHHLTQYLFYLLVFYIVIHFLLESKFQGGRLGFSLLLFLMFYHACIPQSL